jgi:hypothetical protein
MPRSEIARLRQEQAMQEQAAQQGLQDFATVAPHKIINARMERDAPSLLQLLQAGKIEQCNQAVSKMATELNRLEERGS